MQLKKLNSKWMRKHQSIVGERTIKELNGIICYDINSSFSSKKSICTSRTFGKMVTSLNDLSSSISMYTARCAEKLRAQNSSAMLAHIFVSTNPFKKFGVSNFKSSKSSVFKLAFIFNIPIMPLGAKRLNKDKLLHDNLHKVILLLDKDFSSAVLR